MTDDPIGYESVTRRIGHCKTNAHMDSYPISLETKEKRGEAFVLEANLSVPIKESSGKERERNAVYYQEVRTDSPPAFGNAE